MEKDNENYLMLNGHKIVLTEDVVKDLFGKNKEILMETKKDYFKREEGEFYTIDGNGRVIKGYDSTSNAPSISEADLRYMVGNYFKDEDFAKQRALYETLNRLLWKFACENGELENEWNESNEHWYINGEGECLEVNYIWEGKDLGVYFPSEEIALRALDEIVKPFMKEHPEFVW